MTVSIDYAPFTVATLANGDVDFVVATAGAFEPPVFNTPDGRPPVGFPRRPSDPRPNNEAMDLIYTPVNVEVEQVLSGSSRPGSVRILIEGGTAAVHYVSQGKSIECFTEWASPVPHVVTGSRYVLVLTTALNNGGVQPLPFRKAFLAWPVSSTGSVSTVDGLMRLDRLAEIVRGARTSPEPVGTGAPS